LSSCLTPIQHWRLATDGVIQLIDSLWPTPTGGGSCQGYYSRSYHIKS
jgi:hypothetical protein